MVISMFHIIEDFEDNFLCYIKYIFYNFQNRYILNIMKIKSIDN